MGPQSSWQFSWNNAYKLSKVRSDLELTFKKCEMPHWWRGIVRRGKKAENYLSPFCDGFLTRTHRYTRTHRHIHARARIHEDSSRVSHILSPCLFPAPVLHHLCQLLPSLPTPCFLEQVPNTALKDISVSRKPSFIAFYKPMDWPSDWVSRPVASPPRSEVALYITIFLGAPFRSFAWNGVWRMWLSVLW